MDNRETIYERGLETGLRGYWDYDCPETCRAFAERIQGQVSEFIREFSRPGHPASIRSHSGDPRRRAINIAGRARCWLRYHQISLPKNVLLAIDFGSIRSAYLCISALADFALLLAEQESQGTAPLLRLDPITEQRGRYVVDFRNRRDCSSSPADALVEASFANYRSDSVSDHLLIEDLTATQDDLREAVERFTEWKQTRALSGLTRPLKSNEIAQQLKVDLGERHLDRNQVPRRLSKLQVGWVTKSSSSGPPLPDSIAELKKGEYRLEIKSLLSSGATNLKNLAGLD